MSSSPHPEEEPSVATALGEIMQDTQKLLHQEVQLGKAEVRGYIKKRQRTLVLAAGALWMAMLGSVVAGLALIRILQKSGLSVELSYVVVAVVFLGVSIFLLSIRKEDVPSESMHLDAITARRIRHG